MLEISSHAAYLYGCLYVSVFSANEEKKLAFIYIELLTTNVRKNLFFTVDVPLYFGSFGRENPAKEHYNNKANYAHVTRIWQLPIICFVFEPMLSDAIQRKWNFFERKIYAVLTTIHTQANEYIARKTSPRF